jgi:hypothetical protein
MSRFSLGRYKHRLQAVAAIGRVLQRESVDAGHRLRRRGHRMGLVNRRQVFQAREALGRDKRRF